MPAAYAPIPLPNRGSSSSNYAACEPAFATPVRWTLIVLSWLAFGIASYLAYASVSGASVAGCGPASTNGCDIVLSSSWSKLFGIPVAVVGLACYATLATLSVLLGWRERDVNRRITTAFVMLAIVAAGASLWFIGVQVFAIGHYCKFCLATDACGILIGIFAVAAAVQCVLAHRGSSQQRVLQPGLMALRTATTPTAPRTSAASASTHFSPPSLLAAFGGAVPVLLLLVVGQLLFRGQTHRTENVALNNTIKMDDSSNGDATGSSDATPHVALRVPDPLEENDGPPKIGADAKVDADPKGEAAKPDENAATASRDLARTSETETKADVPPVEPARERILKLLGGKLTLNAYQHPMIGSPEAPYVVVEMVSYDCAHCRKMHALMKKAQERFGDQVALLVMPFPQDKDCNELLKKLIDEGKAGEAASHRGACGTARRACGIARLDPSAFVKFHDFLMSGGDEPPAMGQIVPKANGLVNREHLRQIIGSPEIKKQIEGYVDLFGQLQAKSRDPKKFGLPVQILGDKVVHGSVEKVDDICKAWEANLGVKPK